MDAEPDQTKGNRLVICIRKKTDELWEVAGNHSKILEKGSSKNKNNENGKTMCGQKSRKNKSAFTSYLLKKQSLYFTAKDFDWLHIARLEMVRKQERARRREKQRQRIQEEFLQFLLQNCENEDILKEFLCRNIPPVVAKERSPDEDSGDSEAKVGKADRFKVCKYCKGKCGLTRRYKYEFVNYHLIHRHKRSAKCNSVIDSGSESDLLDTTAEIERLFKKSEIISFLRTYKIPKIKPDNSWAEEEMMFFDYPTEMPESLTDLEYGGNSDYRRVKKFVRLRRRESKFDYAESSDSSENDEMDTFSSTFTDCTTDTSLCIPRIPDTSEEYVAGQFCRGTQAGNCNDSEEDDEDILSLFAENEEIKLPTLEKSPQKRKKTFFG